MSPPTPSDAERRVHIRHPLHTIAFVVLPNRAPIEVRTLDISEGGLCIVADANPQKGIRFTLKFQIPCYPKGNTPIEAEVEVTHSIFSSHDGGFKIGLRFTRINNNMLGAIKQFAV